MRIDFLYWQECPSHDEALERLRQVLKEERVDADVVLTHVGTEDEARGLEFPGSPTIRVDGRDIQPEGTNGAAQWGLTCRLYVLEDGRPSPLPSFEMIRRAVRTAVGRTKTLP